MRKIELAGSRKLPIWDISEVEDDVIPPPIATTFILTRKNSKIATPPVDVMDIIDVDEISWKESK